jgi:hypothetical protein
MPYAYATGAVSIILCSALSGGCSGYKDRSTSANDDCLYTSSIDPTRPGLGGSKDCDCSGTAAATGGATEKKRC